jgi:hypothetical protein
LVSSHHMGIVERFDDIVLEHSDSRWTGRGEMKGQGNFGEAGRFRRQAQLP